MSAGEVKVVINVDAAKGAAAIDKVSNALGKQLPQAAAAGAKAIGLTAQQSQQLSFQLTDIVTGLTSGQSPFTVLMQQGGQLKDVFGGVGGALRAVATVLTPVNLAIGGVAAVIGSVALAAYQGYQETTQFNKALLLTGNYAGMSAGRFNEAAKSIQAQTGATIGASRELLQGATATAAFGAQSIEPVTRAMATLQTISGASADDVVADFASMSRGVVAWAVEHNRQYAFLTKAQYDQIKSLEQQGKTEEAMALTANTFNDVMKARKTELGTLQQAWKSLAEAASEAWDRMMAVGRPDTTDTKIKEVKALIAANARRTDMADSRGPNGDLRKGAASYGAELQLQLENLQKQGRGERGVTEQNAAAAAEARKKITDDASGKADALANARIDLSLARDRNASAARLAVLGLEQDRISVAYQLGLNTLQAYEEQRLAITRKEVAEKAAEIDREIALERRRPTNGPASEAAQQTKITGLQGARAAAIATGVKAAADARAAIERAAVDTSRQRALEWAAAWTSANDEVKALTSANQDAAIALIKDPNEQARAQTAKAIADQQRALEIKLVPLRSARDLAPTAGASADLQAKIDEVQAGTDQSIKLKSQGLAEGLKPGWQKMLEGWKDTNRLMRESFDTLMDGVVHNAEDAWVELVTTGKLNVKNLVNGFIVEMAKLQFRKFAANFSFGDILGSLGSFLSGARADGGPVSAGGTYLVGERGPELLRMGGRSGTVIPNHALARGANAGTSVAITLAPVIQIDARSDQAQVAQLVAAGMAQTQKDLWAQLRARGLA